MPLRQQYDNRRKSGLRGPMLGRKGPPRPMRNTMSTRVIDELLLSVLACPACVGELRVAAADVECIRCRSRYPVVDDIPRFVPADEYAQSFGYQWNHFRATQLDAESGVPLSEERFFSETGWSPEWLSDKIVLDVGCGAGRFAEVASRYARAVVAMDFSSAVTAARTNLESRSNVHVVQGDIYRLPFRTGAFDASYCIGVLQHTPDPVSATRALPRVVRRGGQLAVTVYERRRITRLHSKYLLRKVTSRMRPGHLLMLVRAAMPLLFTLSEILFRVPALGRVFRHVIPVANYVDERRLGIRKRYSWALLDTLDMLSPRYDQPQTEQELRSALQSGGAVGINRLPNPGLNLVATIP